MMVAVRVGLGWVYERDESVKEMNILFEWMCIIDKLMCVFCKNRCVK